MGQEARANQLCAIEQGDDDAAVTSCPPVQTGIYKPISWSWTRWREMIIVAEQRRAAEREREKRRLCIWLVNYASERAAGNALSRFPSLPFANDLQLSVFRVRNKKKKKETKQWGTSNGLGIMHTDRKGMYGWTTGPRLTPNEDAIHLSLALSLGLSVRMR